MSAKKLIVIAVLLCSVTTFTQTPEAPQPKFMSKSNMAEMSGVAMSLAADAISTQAIFGWRDISEPNHLIPHSRVGTAMYFGSAFASDVAAVYFLRKHPWYHRVFNVAMIGWEFHLAFSNYSAVVAARRLARQPLAIHNPPCGDGCITVSH